jgi:hypothetical protein
MHIGWLGPSVENGIPIDKSTLSSRTYVAQQPGANPTTVSYNASVVKIHNATSSLVRFKDKNRSFYLQKTL